MKTITLYGLQIMVGLVALAAGYAKLSGMAFVAEPFAMIGLGKTFLTLAGSAEVLAGLCLMFPRAGVIGAVLLASVVVCTMGASVGYVISHRGGAEGALSQTLRTGMHGDAIVKSVIIRKSQGWDI
jgi:uncharacterized membrane protein YphA (DoxX/SURF4 family)